MTVKLRASVKDKRLIAQHLLAEGKLSDRDIAKAFQIPMPALLAWKKQPAFICGVERFKKGNAAMVAAKDFLERSENQAPDGDVSD